MPTTPPTAPLPLGASMNERSWWFQVNTGTVALPVWTTIGGITNDTFDPDAAQWQDDSTFDSGGFGSQAKTATGWSCALTLARKVVSATPTQYDAGQEYLRLHAIGKLGPAASVQIRIFEYEASDPTGLVTPRVEAYTGTAGCQWANSGGGNTAFRTVVATLNGQGALLSIVHPFPAG